MGPGYRLRLIAVATLVLLSVHLVDIPMKVFAFMGGALAIAAGFGAQTLLKNLISGIMLLAERPVRVGDLVHVGNVIARAGSTGRSTGAHVHLEVWDNGHVVNPTRFLALNGGGNRRG